MPAQDPRVGVSHHRGRHGRRGGRRREGSVELLDVLTRTDADRAALIGRLHQRADTGWLAEVLIDLEEDESPRLRMIEALRRVV